MLINREVETASGLDRDVRTKPLRTEALAKHFADVKAVDGLDLEIEPGEIYGFLGRNGAGKTTSIRMMLGLIRPTAGRVFLFGREVGKERREAVRPVGCLVETATAYGSLTVRENLEIQRRLTGAPKEAVARAIEMFRLNEFTDRRAARLSLGNKQRLALARAVINRPRLLILDEPANTLDPAGIVEIRGILRRFRDEEGVSVFVSSHILSEVALLADRIGIIHRGRLIEEITLSGESTDNPAVEIKVSDPHKARRILADTLTLHEIEEGADGRLLVRSAIEAAPRIARALVDGGVDLHLLRPVVEDLEARFLRLTEGE